MRLSPTGLEAINFVPKSTAKTVNPWHKYMDVGHLKCEAGEQSFDIALGVMHPDVTPKTASEKIYPHLLRTIFAFTDQHRHFPVSSVGQLTRDDGTRIVLWGNNAKPFNDDDPIKAQKFCSERVVNRRAIVVSNALGGGFMLDKMMLMGQAQPDKQSGRDTNVLDTCGECRDTLLLSPIVTPKLEIITINANEPNFSAKTTLGELVIDHHRAAILNGRI